MSLPTSQQFCLPQDEQALIRTARRAALIKHDRELIRHSRELIQRSRQLLTATEHLVRPSQGPLYTATSEAIDDVAEVVIGDRRTFYQRDATTPGPALPPVKWRTVE